MRRRSNLLVLIGLVAVIIGCAVVYLITTDNDDDSDGVASGDSAAVEVVVAKQSLASGTLGDDVLAQDLYEIQRVPASARAPDALTSASELSNQILNNTFPEGEQLRRSGLRPRSLLSQQITVPAGFEALAVNVDFVAGGAGYIAPGDKVNVFAVVPAAVGEVPYVTPRVELLLTNVDVLDVSQQVAPGRSEVTSTDPSAPSAARSGGGALTALLALSTADAEKIIFASTVGDNSIYLSRVNTDAAPAQPTPGQDSETILIAEAIEAFQQAHPNG